MRYRAQSQGFALPTVVITTVIMFAVLVAAVSVVSSTRVSLDTQFFEGLAADAAESGATHAESCLKDNNFVSTWGTNVLRPDTTCSGVGAPSTCSVSACWLVNTTQYRTTYRVEQAQDAGGGVQTVKITGTVQLLRAGSGTVWDTFTKTLNIRVGAQITAQQVAFGYIGYTGVYFGVVGRDGTMRTVGYNGYGMLGNGTQTNTLTPTKFNAPTVYPIVAAYTNFLSVGFEFFAVDSQGDVYGAGANDLGQLGNGTFVHPVTTPTKMILPAGVKAVYLSSLGWTSNYVIGSDNNIYATGACAYGLLGNNYTISGCSNRSSYVRVNLPTPNTSDPNTLPVTGSGVPADNIVSDRYNVAVRMQGGRVYIWGINDVGVLGTGNNTDSSNPIKLGVYGDAGQPKATQLAFDGETLYVLDNTGAVNAVGNGTYSSLAGAPAQIQNQASNKCLNNASNLTTAAQARLYDCIDALSQQMTFNPYTIDPSGSVAYGTISTSPDSSTKLCLDVYAGQTADNSPVYWYPCQPDSVNQRWVFRDDNTIWNPMSGKCLNNANGNQANDAPIGIWTCSSTYADQRWNLMQSKKLTKVPIPTSAGKVLQIATDQWSVLFRTETGEVWSAGNNDRGQLCTGNVGKVYNPKLTKVTLPAGRQAVYVYTTKSGLIGADHANTYIIMDDGSVWGCGANTFGQLGNGSTAASVGSLVKMNLPSGVAAGTVQTGYGTTVVLTAAGTVYTVGNNGNGQLGDGTTTNRSTPILAKYINDQAAISY